MLTLVLLIFLPFLIPFGLFLLSAWIERRSLLCGILFVAAGFGLLFSLMICYQLLKRYLPDAAAFGWVRSLLPLVTAVVGFLPTLMVLITLAAGVTNLVQDGLHLRNTFAVFFSTAVLAYSILWPLVGKLRIGTVSSMIYGYVTAILVYTILLKTVLTVTSFINLFHLRRNHRLDYVAVLGRPLRNEQIEGMVHDRVDKAIQVYRNNPGARLVLSGGWRKYQEAPECQLMADYAVSRGVPREDILLEAEGDSTIAMVKNTYTVMREDFQPKGKRTVPRFAVVSTAYHVLRALFIARKNKIKCIGFGARTKLHISMNAFVREYVQYLKLTRRTHLILFLVFTVAYWAGSAILMKKGVLSPRVWQSMQ